MSTTTRRKYRFKSRQEAEDACLQAELEKRCWLWLYAAEQRGESVVLYRGDCYRLVWFRSPSGFSDFYAKLFWPNTSQCPSATFYESYTECYAALQDGLRWLGEKNPDRVEYEAMEEALVRQCR